jgi:hypothetical protein
MPRRIAQERVPTASNVGSRDVTSASQPTPLIPFGVFSRVSRAPDQLEGKTNSKGQVKYCRCTFLDMPRRIAQECLGRIRCRVARCDIGLPAHTSHPIWLLFACFWPIRTKQWTQRGPETHPVRSMQKSSDMLTKSIKEVLGGPSWLMAAFVFTK